MDFKIHLLAISIKIMAQILAMLKIERSFHGKDQIPRLMTNIFSDISAAQADIDFKSQKKSRFIEWSRACGLLCSGIAQILIFLIGKTKLIL